MNFKIISSLEKCFWDQHAGDKKELTSFSMLKNERYSFQVLYNEDEKVNAHICVECEVISELAPYIKMYRVKHIPSEMPVYKDAYDKDYIRTTPGLYPDCLEPLTPHYRLKLNNNLNTLWFEVDPKGNVPAGNYDITVRFNDYNANHDVTVKCEIINAELPPQEFTFTQWFYADCLMNYYRTKKYDDRHWKAIENFMANAAKYGQNMILTPVLSPELDTAPGLYRNETQLVNIEVKDGKYIFDFANLGKWVDLCDKTGIKFLEINHFFSQWGAAFCPQVWATVDGEYKRIFGWENASDSPEYSEFLKALIPALLKYLRKEKNGADKRCCFHISDEPSVAHIEQYKKVMNIVKPLVEGLPIMDALSEYEFYELGLVERPVPAISVAQNFYDHGVPNLWTYYCCGPSTVYSNRFFGMSSARTRIVGLQFYKYNIVGFLQWGYNFYNSQLSFAEINPFNCSDGECFAPSGDPFSVYPGTDLTPWPSLREVCFGDGIQDLRALKLLESLIGREKTIAAIEEGIEPITFANYPKNSDYLLNVREKINRLIKENI